MFFLAFQSYKKRRLIFAQIFSVTLSKYFKEFKFNTKLAIPVILGMLGHQVVALVDKIMVGQLGGAELAAVSVGSSVMCIAMSVGSGFAAAITTLGAEADGEGTQLKGKAAFKHGLFLCMVL